MYLVVRSFESGERRWTVNELAAELDLPSAALGPVIDALEGAGLLVSTEREALLPARDPAAITLAEVLRVVRTGRPQGGALIREARTVAAADAAADRVEASIDRALAGRTLREFVTERPGLHGELALEFGDEADATAAGEDARTEGPQPRAADEPPSRTGTRR
jgi:DNA-binding IscR family transcriptional regulator